MTNLIASVQLLLIKRIQLLFFLLIANYVFTQQTALGQQGKNAAASWLQLYDFNPSYFKSPPLQVGPMARWWWPGNLVTKDELKREINLFADNGFAGVRIGLYINCGESYIGGRTGLTAELSCELENAAFFA